MEKIYRVQMNSSGMPNFSTAVEIADRPQGEWIKPYGDSRFMCSICKGKENVPTCMGKPSVWDYCPNCGARMKGADKDETNSSEKPNNSTRSILEQVDKDINVRSKDEPQTERSE